MAETHRRTIRVLLAAVTMLVAATFGGATIATAKATPAQKCQKTIDKTGSGLSKSNLKSLYKCSKKIVKSQVKGQGGDLASCLVAKAVLSTKKIQKLEKACPADVVTGAPSEAGTGLGFRGCASRDATCSASPVTDAASLAACLECSNDFETDCLFAATYALPRPQCDTP